MGAILRDEGKYVAEWLAFHHLVGFDRFVLVLHNCTDDTEQQIALVKKKLGLDICVHHCTDTGKRIQMGSYKWIHQQYGKATEWLLFLDGDEYCFNVDPTVNYRDDIKTLLRSFNDRVAAVSFHGAVFGSSGHIVQPNSRVFSYFQRLPLSSTSCQAVKTFIRASKMTDVISPHIQKVQGGILRSNGTTFTVVDGWRSEESAVHYPIRFNHYYTGSVEDWLKRYKRGSTNDLRPNHAYSLDEFFFHTQGMEYDDVIMKYKGWFLSLLERLK